MRQYGLRRRRSSLRLKPLRSERLRQPWLEAETVKADEHAASDDTGKTMAEAALMSPRMED
jgi:hypothetical protein